MQNMLFIEHYTRKDQWKVPVGYITYLQVNAAVYGLEYTLKRLYGYNHKVLVEIEGVCTTYLFAGST